MPISDVFKGQRGGLYVGGKLEGGAVQVGTTVRVLPSNELATVKSVEVDGAATPAARAGDTADLTLAGSIAAAFCVLRTPTCAAGVCSQSCCMTHLPMSTSVGMSNAAAAHAKAGATADVTLTGDNIAAAVHVPLTAAA